ncbi:undecaprenyldiphospho-muramoylpentapeptide beta-N-acetylglucosaminyltransferase [Adlercreutzia sp. ZJ141]|uniref:undecaprenyldiphospho-muramoylpentapeptide beta-N-acetylglucosaminyltransferase n=1 Tax=Adlercreutzia sp. ZJ141 TaxID=2709406 RepID=UPI0013EDFDB9|nr:undecaprenyldiphospho-muramoylpentapeptide beta-N-acetylglucosaminyltransferase [Adlercreutzia sp. ZJ141]
MRIVLSGGGTAGHINPALAVADTLRQRGCEVLYAGTPTGVEARLVQQADIPFTGFEASGFDRSRPWTLPASVAKLLASSRQAAAWFSEVKPDAVVCFGGYVCIPVGRAACKRGVPVVVHEQNSVMGMANAYLARRAARVCLTYEHAAKGLESLPEGVVSVTGNPVRASVFAATRAESREQLGVAPDALLLLVTGGSLGARHLNQAVIGMKDELLARSNVQVIHVAGKRDFERTRAELALTPDEARRWQIVDYTDRMGQCMAAADVIVSRAGASTLAEVSARALPALLVPFPYATADHQTVNAQSCVDAGAAFMVSDDQVEGSVFRDQLCALLDDASLRERMREAARAQKTQDAAGLVADAVMEAARDNSRVCR